MKPDEVRALVERCLTHLAKDTRKALWKRVREAATKSFRQRNSVTFAEKALRSCFRRVQDKFNMDEPRRKKLKKLNKLCDDVETFTNKKLKRITEDEAFAKLMERIKSENRMNVKSKDLLARPSKKQRTG